VVVKNTKEKVIQMKLKCNHDRRVHVLPSGNTVHRNDGSVCLGDGNPFKPYLSIGGKKVTKYATIHDVPGLPIGSIVLGVGE